MKLLSPAERDNLERSTQMKTVKKNTELQKSRQKELQHLSSTISIPHNKKKNMKRLQARSYPPGCDIILDSRHTDFVTPHTFNDLEEGKHVVEMHYIEPKTAELITKKEEVEIKQGQRAVCKLFFKEPKMLALD